MGWIADDDVDWYCRCILVDIDHYRLGFDGCFANEELKDAAVAGGSESG